MIVSLHERTRMQAGGSLLTIAMPTTAKAIRKPGKNRPASSRSRIPGPPLRNFTKKICFETKPSATSLRLGSRAEGFAKADFFGASPVASALDLGVTPIPRPSI